VSGRLEAHVMTTANPDVDSSHPSSFHTAFYINASDHTLAGEGAYTVRYTQTNPQETTKFDTYNVDGSKTATITASATTVPTSNAKYFEWEVTAEADEGDENEEIADFSLNLIFEHSSLPTITYVCDWSLHAMAVAESSE